MCRFRFFSRLAVLFLLFFYNATATTEIYTLSLHDALPIFVTPGRVKRRPVLTDRKRPRLMMRHHCALGRSARMEDRKSTRLNSSHRCISYAVFCLKKKNKKNNTAHTKTTNKQSTHRTTTIS